MNLQEIKDKIASEMIAHGERIRAIVEKFSDEELVEIIKMCRTEAKPDDTKNFPMPEWDDIADTFLAELGLRKALDEAKASGLDFYCLHCRGKCTPEHIAEMG